jgi:D-Tyr-tRNAtyr deacylase
MKAVLQRISRASVDLEGEALVIIWMDGGER